MEELTKPPGGLKSHISAAKWTLTVGGMLVPLFVIMSRQLGFDGYNACYNSV